MQGSHLIQIFFEEDPLKSGIAFDRFLYDRGAAILRGIVHDEALEILIVLFFDRDDRIANDPS